MSSVLQKSKEGIAYELHKAARVRYPRRRITIKGLNDLWQADLTEMQPYSKFNKGYRYILFVIDSLSKFLYAEPLKSKTGQDVSIAFQKILKNSQPSLLLTDKGKEFFNKNMKEVLKKYGIHHYHTYSPMKAAMVERVQKTIKGWMWREFSARGSYKWLELLPELVNKYNHRVHRTIGMKPADVQVAHVPDLLKKVNQPYQHTLKRNRFNVGDRVRISKQKFIFTKGYTPSWSTEIFTINTVQPTVPITYLLKDWLGEPVLGSFYEEELAKTNYPDTYLVERVLRYSKDKKQAYVKFLGFSQPSWIPSEDVE